MASVAPITGAPTRAPSIDRRSLLGVMAFASVVTGAATQVAAAAAPSLSHWHYLCETEVTAFDALIAYRRGTLDPISKKYDRVVRSFELDVGVGPSAEQRVVLDATGLREAEAREVDLGVAHADALLALLEWPAPTASGFLYKMRLMLREEAWEYRNFETSVAPVLAADVERFRAEAACER